MDIGAELRIIEVEESDLDVTLPVGEHPDEVSPAAMETASDRD